jgi:ABC-2 type transport system permease protein
MKYRPVFGIVARQFYLIRRSPVRVISNLGSGVIEIVLWGLITTYLRTLGTAEVRFVGGLLGMVLLWNFCQRIMSGITFTFLEDVWSRNFLNIFASPLTTAEYLTGLVISGALMTALNMFVMLALVYLAFGLNILTLGIALVSLGLILFVFGTTLGVIGCAVLLRFGPSAEWLIWPLPGLISWFACVFYPLSALPSWMQIIAKLIPASYVFEAARQILLGRGYDSLYIGTGALVALVELTLAFHILMRVYRHAIRTGLIARYSAEAI